MNTWHDFLLEESKNSYFKKLRKFVETERKHKVIYPEPANVFRAFYLTPLEQIKVVILGQDPYHGPQQADGLAFSVPYFLPIPPSLRNIFVELKRDTGSCPQHGDLSSWARQGIFLLNTTLTVAQGKANSHAGCGWSILTMRALQHILFIREHVIVVLWGSYAQQAAGFVDRNRHTVLKCGHPSPFSYEKYFKNNGHFASINQILESKNESAISWHTE